ncbi:MAG: pseudouridine synthase [Holophaga sp.]|nr:pseudouridine synthase [Holophaga sp.]
MAKPPSNRSGKRPTKGPPTRQGEHRGAPARYGAKAPARHRADAPASAPSPRPVRDPWAEEAEMPVKTATVKITPARRPGTASGSAMARNTGPWKPAPRPKTGPRPARTAPAAPASASGLKAKGKAPTGERLQKILAAAGVASRRACEAIILDGRVQVNGVTVTELGTRADPRRDEITLDFQPIAREELVYILLNKPKGYVTTVKDDEGRPTVMALIHGVGARVYPVGRLDFNSEGLLLLTNDGAMAQRLMAPEFHVAKVYLAKVHRMPNPETLDEFREGFRLDGRRLKPCGIEVAEKGENPWLMVTLVEGKNQQIRRMFAAVGHPVSKLRRIQFGPLNDPALKPGEWRFCNAQELAALKAL